MNKQLLWNTRFPEKEKVLSDLDIASHHSLLSQKAVLNFSSYSELLIMNMVRAKICGDKDVKE